MKFNSLAFKITLPLLAIIAVVMGSTLILIQSHMKELVEDVFIKEQTQNIKNGYKTQIDNLVSNIVRDGISIASSYEIQTFLKTQDIKNKRLTLQAQMQLKEFKHLFNLDTIYIAEANTRYYFNEEGYIKTVDPKEEQSKWFDETLKSPQRYQINTDTDITGKLHIWIDTKVGDLKHPIGLAGGGIDVSTIMNTAIKEFEYDDVNVFVVNDENLIQCSSENKQDINKKLFDASFSKEKREAIQQALFHKKELLKYTTANSQDRYILFIDIKELQWRVVVDFSKENFLRSLNGAYNKIVVGGTILLFILFLIVGWVFSLLISRPLQELAQKVEEYDFTSDFELESKNQGYEIENIAKAFAHSSNILRATIDQHKENKELLYSLINATDDLIFYKDTQLRYIGCNKAYEKWTTRKITEIIGKKDVDLYPLDIANEHARIDQVVLNEQRTVIVEERLKNKEGEYLIFQVKKSPFYDNYGNVKGVVVIARDMTLFKEMEFELRTINSSLERHVDQKTRELQLNQEVLETHIEELEMANEKLIVMREQALQAAQARSNFISSISHELRTPLNAIINFTDQVIEDFDEMLIDEELQEETQMFLSRVMVNSKHLLQLINDLLEFTKIEAGKMDYSLSTQDITPIVHTAYNNTASLVQGSGVEFRSKIEDAPLMGTIDSRRFLQVLLNLLSNAIKFTKEGYIEIRAYKEEGHVIVEIEDTGKGIPQEKHKSVFDPFVQVDNQDCGTGLGLGLVKRMCDDMNIQIKLKSVEGEGSTFSLIFS